MTDSLPSIISRTEAKALGQKWFFVGSTCKYGHISRRNLSNGSCQECIKIRGACRLKENPRSFLIMRDDGTYEGVPCRKCGCMFRAADKKCPDCRKKYQKENSEKYRENSRNFRKNSPDKFKAIKKRHHKKNPHAWSMRRGLKVRATPPWISKFEVKQINEIYKTCPEGFSVDHIVPLKGKNVSGLHVPWNLQHLEKLENCRKSNKFPYGEESERLAVRHPSVARLYGVAWPV